MSPTATSMVVADPDDLARGKPAHPASAAADPAGGGQLKKRACDVGYAEFHPRRGRLLVDADEELVEAPVGV